MSRLIELADKCERAANNAQISADYLWGWRARDKRASVAFGQIGKDLRGIADLLRTLSQGGKK